MEQQPEIAQWKQAVNDGECALTAARQMDASVKLAETVMAYCIKCIRDVGWQTQAVADAGKYFAETRLPLGNYCSVRERMQQEVRSERYKPRRRIETVQPNNHYL